MMDPGHERARLLSLAIGRAVELLQGPITRIEVTDDKVLCSAGSQTLSLSYGYADTLDAAGAAIPGSGHWWVAADGPIERREVTVPRALGRVAGRWLRGRGLLP